MAEPVLVGLLFADRIIIENNGKKGIIGTFSIFNSPNFPVVFPPWAIYAAVTNLQGKHTFSINLVHEPTSQVILPINGEFEARELSDVVELTPTIMGAVFPRDGVYSLTFNIDGAQVGSRILIVKLLQNSGGD
jgi:hypothetical protein